MEKYIWRNEQDFDAFLRDTVLLRQFLNKEESEPEVQQITDKDYKIFLYEETPEGNYELLFWNTQSILPDIDLISKEQSGYIISLANGQYETIRKKITSDNKNIIALYLLPIRRQYVLESEYLHNGFVNQPNLEESYTLVFSPTNFPIQSITGTTLFYLQPKSFIDTGTNDWVTLLLRILGALLTLFFLHNVAVAVSKSLGAVAGVSFMVILLIGLRTISYYYPIPANLRQFELFDPGIYGSSFISPSLGDLLINSLIFFWLVIFARVQIYKKAISFNIYNTTWKRVIIVVLSIVLLITTFICGHVIRSLVADSQISFDVTNFFTLNTYSVFGFIVLCCVSLSYFIFSQSILKMITALIKRAKYLQIVLIAFL